MSEYMYGITYAEPGPDEMELYDRIARKHGGEKAGFCWCNLPDGCRGWFYHPGLGEPHDSNIADAVLTEISHIQEADDHGYTVADLRAHYEVIRNEY